METRHIRRLMMRLKRFLKANKPDYQGAYLQLLKSLNELPGLFEKECMTHEEARIYENINKTVLDCEDRIKRVDTTTVRPRFYEPVYEKLFKLASDVIEYAWRNNKVIWVQLAPALISCEFYIAEYSFENPEDTGDMRMRLARLVEEYSRSLVESPY